MRVGILTLFHGNNNWGGDLQGYALKAYIEDNFKDTHVDLIKYRSGVNVIYKSKFEQMEQYGPSEVIKKISERIVKRKTPADGLLKHYVFLICGKAMSNSIAVGTVQYCTQFLAIYIFKNYYFYLIMAILSQIANNIVTSNIVSRMYPDYLPKGKLSKKVTRSINGRIKDLFIAKLGGVVLNSADTIVISAFLGLTLLAVYQNYYFIISSICGIMETLLTSIRAGLGNSYVTESREKNYIDLKKITFMFYWLIGMCTCCFLGVFQPFMELWVGESFLLPFSVVVLLCVYFYLYETTRLLNVFKDAGGVWHEDRFRPLISALVNLSLNLAAVKYIGIYGIVLSTIVALGMIEVPWLLRNIFTVMYDSSLFNDYFKMFVSWIVATVFSCASITVLTYKVTLSGWGAFAFFVVVSVLIPNIVFLLLMHRKEEFKLSISMVNRITHNKLPIIKNL